MKLSFKNNQEFITALSNGAYLKHSQSGIIVYLPEKGTPEGYMRRILRRKGILNPEIIDLESLYKDNWELHIPSFHRLKGMPVDGYKYMATCCKNHSKKVLFSEKPSLGEEGWVNGGNTKELDAKFFTRERFTSDWRWTLVSVH